MNSRTVLCQPLPLSKANHAAGVSLSLGRVTVGVINRPGQSSTSSVRGNVHQHINHHAEDQGDGGSRSTIVHDIVSTSQDRPYTSRQEDTGNPASTGVISDPISLVRQEHGGFLPANLVPAFRNPRRPRYPVIRLNTVDTKSYASVSHRPRCHSEEPQSETDDEVDIEPLIQRENENLDMVAAREQWDQRTLSIRQRWNDIRRRSGLGHPRYLSDDLHRFVRAEQRWLFEGGVQSKVAFATFLVVLLQCRVVNDEVLTDVWCVLHEAANEISNMDILTVGNGLTCSHDACAMAKRKVDASRALKQYQCDIGKCDEGFAYESDKYKHWRREYPEEAEETMKAWEIYPCGIGKCHKGFAHASSRYRHWRLKHSKQQREQARKAWMTRTAARQIYSCGIGKCHKGFAHECNRYRHWRLKHSKQQREQAKKALKKHKADAREALECNRTSGAHVQCREHSELSKYLVNHDHDHADVDDEGHDHDGPDAHDDDDGGECDDNDGNEYSNDDADVDHEIVREVANSDLKSIDRIRSTLYRLATSQYSILQSETQSKLEAAKSVHISANTAVKVPKNPFAGLIAASEIHARASTSATLSIQMKSHGPSASQGWTTITIPTKISRRSSVVLPTSKMYSRLGPGLLARNSRILRHLPYHGDKSPEVQRQITEDIAQWYHTDHRSIYRQRHCLELAQYWQPMVAKLISDLELQWLDILWVMLNTDDCLRCSMCGTTFQKTDYSNIMSQVPQPKPISQDRARHVLRALMDLAGTQLWHIVSGERAIKGAPTPADRHRPPPSMLCLICFVHDCPTHGAYSESRDPAPARSDVSTPSIINDEEQRINERIRIVINHTERHEDCRVRDGIFCVDKMTVTRSLLGRQSNGVIDGICNPTVQMSRPVYNDDQACGERCFWPADKRVRFKSVADTRDFLPVISEDDRSLVQLMLWLYGRNPRVPCMIAADVCGLSCLDAFYYVLALTQQPVRPDRAQVEQRTRKRKRKPSRNVSTIGTSQSSALDERPPFRPCDHVGPCTDDQSTCRCAQSRVHCEYPCGCDVACKRRFGGCTCAGENEVCFDDDRCECWVQNRECDPWLCKGCGVLEVLDPGNKYRDDIRRGRCRNASIQIGQPARTVLGRSEIHGWGLFAGQHLEANAFIGEYKGEIVGKQESDRRGSIYHHQGREYLFTLNNEQEIDGSRFGNKMRFMNHSRRDDHINVGAKKLLCYGALRVMLYAKRPIKAGDELLYNYNYPDSVTRGFREKGCNGSAPMTAPRKRIRLTDGVKRKRVSHISTVACATLHDTTISGRPTPNDSAAAGSASSDTIVVQAWPD